METINQQVLRKDNRLVSLTHLTQLLHYFTGIGGFLVPLIIWFASKNTVLGMDEHGRSIINFQLLIRA